VTRISRARHGVRRFLDCGHEYVPGWLQSASCCADCVWHSGNVLVERAMVDARKAEIEYPALFALAEAILAVTEEGVRIIGRGENDDLLEICGQHRVRVSLVDLFALSQEEIEGGRIRVAGLLRRAIEDTQYQRRYDDYERHYGDHCTPSHIGYRRGRRFGRRRSH